MDIETEQVVYNRLARFRRLVLITVAQFDESHYVYPGCNRFDLLKHFSFGRRSCL